MVKKTVTTTTITTVTTIVGGPQHDYILLDRSGSMTGKWEDSLGGVNSYVDGLAKDDATKDILVTMAVFDDQQPFEILRKGVKASEWKPVTSQEASPRGFTPLYDAVGRLVNQAREDMPEKSAIVIVTDGGENNSREYNKDSAKKMLDECRAKGWQVIFLGANFDNFQQSSSLGGAVGQTMSYDTVNTKSVFRSMAGTRSVYASGIGQNMSFSDEDRKVANAPKDANK